ncbi:GHKL domain-containing protein [Luteimonas yindakuii]|uniref:sensor histidine kinase n=1 Tax=Luteimonas yindakuii TaxID=2565782 RepID=UPI0010A3EAC2|nr:ATP-binding protein [Luteimonas yindakuii]QCO68618.1 GHKL domain-containing protein [Luteimonas yindakuii]
MTPARRATAPDAAAGARLDDVLAAVPFACAAYARDDGRLLAANTAFRTEFGRLDGHDRRDDLLAALHGSGVDIDPGSEVRAPHNDRWYALYWREAATQPPALLLTAVDISERIEILDSHKSRQDKLLFTSRLMSVGEMAATLAHELNQPLAAIVNYLNGSLRLVGQAGGPVQVERALLAARTQAEHASAVIARVREFVRAREPRRDAQDVAVIVQTVVELLRLEAERQQLRIDIALDPGMPAAYADRVMVEQVLLNLVKNAIEAMREVPAARRALRVEGRVDLDGAVELRVLDRGKGLSAAESEQLFSPFFTTKSDGLGIGLAICRSIIEYHEGRLFFEPRQDGGSVFGFTLPPAEGRP